MVGVITMIGNMQSNSTVVLYNSQICLYNSATCFDPFCSSLGL